MFHTNNLAVTTFQGFMKTRTEEIQGFVRHPAPPSPSAKTSESSMGEILNDILGADFYVILGHLQPFSKNMKCVKFLFLFHKEPE